MCAVVSKEAPHEHGHVECGGPRCGLAGRAHEEAGAEGGVGWGCGEVGREGWNVWAGVKRKEKRKDYALWGVD